VLLLQHGLGEYAHRYVRQYNGLIPRLLDAHISVYAIDLRGHGQSTGRRAVTDIRQAVEDHLAARGQLRAQPLPVFALGHSLGGLVTAGSVARDATGLTGVVLSSPLLRLDASPFARRVFNGLARVAPAFPTRALDPAAMTRLAEQVKAAAEDPLMYRGRVPLLLGATALKVAHDNWSLYREWRVPTLILHGTADTITDPAGSRAFYDTIASIDKTLHLVEGGYHELLNDAGRDETLHALLNWLECRLPAGQR
jgi:alpha-beta hydrolase superfamily lysophospholipase